MGESIIQQGLKYEAMPKFSQDLPKDVHHFCFDVQKWNLAYLMVPAVDTTGVSALIGNPIAAAINTYMDTQTRVALRGKPLEFMRYWKSLCRQGVPYIASACPEGYQGVMEIRAQDAHERLFGVSIEGNVVFAKFGRL